MERRKKNDFKETLLKPVLVTNEEIKNHKRAISTYRLKRNSQILNLTTSDEPVLTANLGDPKYMIKKSDRRFAMFTGELVNVTKVYQNL